MGRKPQWEVFRGEVTREGLGGVPPIIPGFVLWRVGLGAAYARSTCWGHSHLSRELLPST